MEEESDKRIKFLNEVWPILQEEKNHNVIREFINKISVLNDEYRFNGGVYPDVMYILSMDTTNGSSGARPPLRGGGRPGWNLEF